MGLASLNLRQLALKVAAFCEVAHSMQPLGHSRSVKVTDFGTDQKCVCTFLLVNYMYTKITNLYPILHCFRVKGTYYQIIAFEGGCFYLSLLSFRGIVKPFNLAALKAGDLACKIILAPFW